MKRKTHSTRAQRQGARRPSGTSKYARKIMESRAPYSHMTKQKIMAGGAI